MGGIMSDAMTDLTGDSEVRSEGVRAEGLGEAERRVTRVTVVRYSKLFNLGGYENERIGASARVGEGDTPERVLAMLMGWVEDQREARKKRERAEREMRRLLEEEERLRAEAAALEERKREVETLRSARCVEVDVPF